MNIRSLKHWFLTILLLPLTTYPAARSQSTGSQQRTSQILFWSALATGTVALSAGVAALIIRNKNKKLNAAAQEYLSEKLKTRTAKKTAKELRKARALTNAAKVEEKDKERRIRTYHTERDLLRSSTINLDKLNTILAARGFANASEHSYFFLVQISNNRYNPLINEINTVISRSSSDPNLTQKQQAFWFYRRSLEYIISLAVPREDLCDVLDTLLTAINSNQILKSNIQGIALNKTTDYSVDTYHPFFTIEIIPQQGKCSAQLVLNELYRYKDKLKNINRTARTFRPIVDHENPSKVVCWYTQYNTHLEQAGYLEDDGVHVKEKFLSTSMDEAVFKGFTKALNHKVQWTDDHGKYTLPRFLLPPRTYHLRHPVTGQL